MKFIVGFILGLAIIPVSLYFYFYTGSAPVATSAQAMPFEKRMATMALDARVKKEAPAEAALPVNDANLVAGAEIYQKQCSVCHGQPGQQITAIAKGMFPRPPQLFHGKGVTDDPAGETYWKAANGIRLTGMPGFKGALSDAELWQVSLLLANADKLPEQAMAILKGSAPAPAADNAASATKTDSHRKK
jgi:mono/diheme cytochrome c family protein